MIGWRCEVRDKLSEAWTDGDKPSRKANKSHVEGPVVCETVRGGNTRMGKHPFYHPLGNGEVGSGEVGGGRWALVFLFLFRPSQLTLPLILFLTTCRHHTRDNITTHKEIDVLTTTESNYFLLLAQPRALFCHRKSQLCTVRIHQVLEDMALTSAPRTPRDLDSFPTLQLFVLGVILYFSPSPRSCACKELR